MRSVYIIFSTIDIGGAEKRFTGLWRSFQKENDLELKVKLVMNPGLYNRLLELNEITTDDENIIVTRLQGNNFSAYKKNVHSFIKNFTLPGDIIHFIGISPLLKLHKRKMLFSLTNSNLTLGGKRNKTVILLSSLLADTIDVLDPDVFKKVRSLFFWKRKNIYRTSNSFCDTDIFHPLPLDQKKDWIVFLGRFTAVKQIEQIVNALPTVFESLKAIGKHDIRFFLLGYGELSEKITAVLNSPGYISLPITCQFEKEPHTILNTSKVFVSLQLYNNYPSKSLLEAMAAGNIPLVTDVGHTRWIAKPDFSYYVPEHFTGDELARSIVDIFSMDQDQWKEKMNAARRLVLSEHTIVKMKNYYKNIYEGL